MAVCLLAVPIKADCLRQSSEVPYFIIENDTDTVLRKIDVLIDENDFTEERLRTLMDHFRETYSEPDMLVMLFESMENYKRAQMGHAEIMLPRKTYATGILIYRGKDQVIRYRAASETYFHTVVVKGVDPFR